jgi:hypothetical protein
MTEDKKYSGKIKAGFITVVIIALVSSIVITSNIPNNMNPLSLDKNDDATWHLVQVIENGKIVLGENATSGTEGWAETFWLNDTQTPSTYLAYNGTYEGKGAEILGYCDNDGDTIDLASENYGYPVVRVEFDSRSKNGASWDFERYMVFINLTGSETISAVAESVNSSNGAGHYGDAVVSASGTDYIWVNFYWDEITGTGSNYVMPDDGTINWSIHIYEKY